MDNVVILLLDNNNILKSAEKKRKWMIEPRVSHTARTGLNSNLSENYWKGRPMCVYRHAIEIALECCIFDFRD